MAAYIPPSVSTPKPEKGTFVNQHKLPRLPIPTLEHTTDLFLKFVRPLLSDDDYKEAVEAVERFRTDPSQGPKLQELLKNFDKTTNAGSYIADYQNIEGYLKVSRRVVINSNPFFLLEDDPTSQRNDQVVRATSLVYSSLKFVSCLKQGKMIPDMVRVTPLCMSQYKRMFGTARIAETGEDIVKVVANSGHVVVLCRGKFYLFQALWEDGTLAVTEGDLMRNIEAIIQNASNAVESEGEGRDVVGVFTTETRHKWASIRRELIQASSINSEIFSIIDSALFILCLDQEAPKSTDERVANMLHGSYHLDPKSGLQIGSCCNRWYDKLQLIVCKNGAAGVNFEHSAVDGHTVLRFASDVFADNIMRFAKSITKTTHGKNYINDILQASYRKPDASIEIEPKRMRWTLNEKVRKQMFFAETAMSDLIFQTETRTLEFSDYGKSFIVSNSMSPDGFVQIAINAAYYTLYGSFVSTYESVMTKQFLHGRTEAGRTTSMELVKFAEAFHDEKKTKGEKLELLLAALKRQKAVVRMCQSGKGVDRHLGGLMYMQMLNKDEISVPELFSSKAYQTLTTSILSTSNCGNPSLRMFGFGPVCEYGFGIGYIIKDDGLQFCISSHHRQTSRFVKTLEAFLLEVKNILKESERSSVNEWERGTTPPKDEEAASDSEEYGYGYFDMGDLPSVVIDNTDKFSSRLVRSRSFQSVSRPR